MATNALRMLVFFALFWQFVAIDRALPDDPSPDPAKVLGQQAIELPAPDTFLLAQGVGPETVELGKLRTGTSYYVKVTFVNMTKEPLKITRAKTTCGCMTAGYSDEKVTSKGSSYFIIGISPQTRESRYAKTVTVFTSAGITWPFLISAQFVPEYRITPEALNVAGGSEFELTLVANFSDVNSRQLKLESLTGITRITGMKLISDNTWLITGQVTDSGWLTTRDVIERFAIKSEGRLICEVPVTIRGKQSIVCKPSIVRMIRKEVSYVGSCLLFGVGEKEELKEGDELLVQISADAGYEIEGKATVRQRNKAVVKVDIQFDAKELQACKSEVASARLLSGNAELCVFQCFRIPEE